jgi:sialic acid synthase SpsE
MTKNIQENIYRLIRNTGSGSEIENIFIIGKGPSIDELEGFKLPAGLIININDSEKIIQGQLGVFSANWVRQSLREKGFGCQYYLAGKPLPSDVLHDVLPPIPFEYDDEDLTIFRMGLDDYFDEPFVLANALKVSGHIAKITDKNPNVYLLGFDFSTAKGEVSKNLGVDFAKNEILERSLVVHSQEYDFLQFAKYFQDNGQINLIHVGTRDYSQLTIRQFREKFSTRIDFKDTRQLQPLPFNENKVLIVAELTNNHLGEINRLVEMVHRAKEAGADLIKIQKRDVDTFYSQEKLSSYYWSPFGKTLRDYRKGVELDEEKLQILSETCKSLNIDWFCSVLDYPSFETIMKFNPKLIKIPSTISNHRDFHHQVAMAYKGTIVISTGFTDKSYEDYVLNTFAANKQIYLLHCISAYPTAIHDCNVSVVRHYADLANQNPSIIPGYSSHDLGSFASVLAVASGARMLEKHVKLGDVDWVHFDKVALDLKTDSFKKYVKDIRDAEIALGSPEKRIMESEHHKYEVVKHKQ